MLLEHVHTPEACLELYHHLRVLLMEDEQSTFAWYITKTSFFLLTSSYNLHIVSQI